MTYELKEIIKMMKGFHEVENAANEFLFQSSFAMKHKKRGAEKTLKAIDEYKKLPIEVREEIERDKSTNINKIREIERLCKQALTN